MSFLVQHPHRLENHIADDFHAFGTQFVYRILGLVPENVAVAIVEINQVSRRDAMANKWHLVVPDVATAGKKMRLVAKMTGSLVYQIFKPRRGVGFALDVQVGIADHIGKNK